jgi:hypothetical protein
MFSNHKEKLFGSLFFYYASDFIANFTSQNFDLSHPMPKKTPPHLRATRLQHLSSPAKYSIPTPGFRLYKTIIKTGAKKTEVATKEITTVKTTKTAKTSTAIVDVITPRSRQPAPPIPVASNC